MFSHFSVPKHAHHGGGLIAVQPSVGGFTFFSFHGTYLLLTVDPPIRDAVRTAVDANIRRTEMSSVPTHAYALRTPRVDYYKSTDCC